MSQTYTRILGRQRQQSAGEFVVYTTPPDTDAVIRELIFNNTLTTPTTLTIVIQSAGGVRYSIVATASLSSGTTRYEQRTAMEPGDELRVISGVAGLWHCYATGFVFER